MRRADVILHYWMDGGHDAHSQSHSDDADDDDDDDDPGPARKPLFLAYTQSRAPHRPTGQGQAIRSMERQRQACCRPCSPASSARWWAVALPPTCYLHLLWAGLVWSVSDLV